MRKALEAEFSTFVKENGVIEPPANYNPLRQLLLNNWQVLLRQMAVVVLAGLATLVTLVVAVIYALRRRQRIKARSTRLEVQAS